MSPAWIDRDAYDRRRRRRWWRERRRWGRPRHRRRLWVRPYRHQPRWRAWGYLLGGSPFDELFLPDGRVPVLLPPIIPRERGAPRCLVADPARLSEAQIAGLAALLYPRWRPECESVEQAAAYIRRGLPLRVSWFAFVTTADYREEPAHD